MFHTQKTEIIFVGKRTNERMNRRANEQNEGTNEQIECKHTTKMTTTFKNDVAGVTDDVNELYLLSLTLICFCFVFYFYFYFFYLRSCFRSFSQKTHKTKKHTHKNENTVF